MSRSHLRSNYMKSRWVSRTKNPHRYDEISKNTLSKYVAIRCPNAHWYRITGSTQGHQVRNEGHRIASGIIRAKVKKETNQEIQFSLLISDKKYSTNKYQPEMIKKTLFFSIIQKNYVPLRSNLNVEPFKVRKGQPNEYKVSIHPHRVLVAATDGWLQHVIIYQTLIIILFLTTQTSWSVHNLYSLWTLNRKN